MGRSLALDVIAEGVETEGQYEFLERFGCHGYQGYLYSQAIPLDGFEAYLAANERASTARSPH
jgi:EAL domain-containing protein (putative c-di-GMP-specific phosphodiesterase class I)